MGTPIPPPPPRPPGVGERVMAWAQHHPTLAVIGVIGASIQAFVLAAFLVGVVSGATETTTATDPEPTPSATSTADERNGGDSGEDSESSDTDPTPATDDTESTKTKPKPKPKRKLWPVVKVADGDTITVRYRGRDESIRIIGIDTPETVHPSIPDECWGPRASDAAKRLLEGRRVALIFDPSQGRRDAYDRLLANVERPGLSDFGLAQIRRGNAIEYTYDTAYQRQDRYRAAERKAKAANKGLWPKCGGADKPLEPSPSQAPAPGGDNCAAGYDPCIPPAPPDLDCADVDGPIAVTGGDPHGLDRDGDGIACE